MCCWGAVSKPSYGGSNLSNCVMTNHSFWSCLSKAGKPNFEGRKGLIVWTFAFYFKSLHSLGMTLTMTSKWIREDRVIFLALLSCTISSFLFFHHRRQIVAIKPFCRGPAFPKVKSHAMFIKKGIYEPWIFIHWT